MAARRPIDDLRRDAGFNTQPPEGGCKIALRISLILTVSTHSHPKVAANYISITEDNFLVSTHSHPKVAAPPNKKPAQWRAVSTHSHPKVAAIATVGMQPFGAVSTHSHPKVAAAQQRGNYSVARRFNTQPPEGGCSIAASERVKLFLFQHTATRRWLRYGCRTNLLHDRFQHTATRRWLRASSRNWHKSNRVSTHSHPKVAARGAVGRGVPRGVSTHSHPKVAACHAFPLNVDGISVSTHSHPKVAAIRIKRQDLTAEVSTHSHPKVAAKAVPAVLSGVQFQHTATRRWLPAAAFSLLLKISSFQHTATRRWLQPLSKALLHQVSQPRFR